MIVSTLEGIAVGNCGKKIIYRTIPTRTQGGSRTVINSRPIKTYRSSSNFGVEQPKRRKQRQAISQSERRNNNELNTLCFMNVFVTLYVDIIIWGEIQ